MCYNPISDLHYSPGSDFCQAFRHKKYRTAFELCGMCGFSGVIKTLAEHFGGAQHGHKGVQVFLVDKLPQLHCFVPGQGSIGWLVYAPLQGVYVAPRSSSLFTKSQIGSLSSQTIKIALHIFMRSNTTSIIRDLTVRPTKE